MIVTIVVFFLIVHYLIKCIGLTRTCCWKKTYWLTQNDCLARWLANATGYLIGRCADWSRKFISNPDWQLCYINRTPSPLYGFASEIGVRFRGSLCVRSGSALGLLSVQLGSALGPFSLVGSGRDCTNNTGILIRLSHIPGKLIRLTNNTGKLIGLRTTPVYW